MQVWVWMKCLFSLTEGTRIAVRVHNWEVSKLAKPLEELGNPGGCSATDWMRRTFGPCWSGVRGGDWDAHEGMNAFVDFEGARVMGRVFLFDVLIEHAPSKAFRNDNGGGTAPGTVAIPAPSLSF